MGITNIICGGHNKAWPDSGTTYFNPRERYKSGLKPYWQNPDYGRWYESINFVNWNPPRRDTWLWRLIIGWKTDVDNCDIYPIWMYNYAAPYYFHKFEEETVLATIDGKNIDLNKDESFKLNVIEKIRHKSLYRGNIDQVLDQLPKLKKERELILKQLS